MSIIVYENLLNFYIYLFYCIHNIRISLQFDKCTFLYSYISFNRFIYIYRKHERNERLMQMTPSHEIYR